MNDDTISRQDTIDRINEYIEEYSEIDSDGNHSEKWCAMQEAKMTIENMPSAQPEPIRINLNEPIKVKLTDWGKKIFLHQYDRVNKAVGREVCKPEYPTEDENGYTEFQLWRFMELYGEHMGMTLPNVIDPLEIVYER